MSVSTAASVARANDRQIGGQHYKTGSVEHWDVIHNADVPYLLGCASKYIARHHLKDGREALLKAIHYQEKWLENVGTSTSLPRGTWTLSVMDLLSWASGAELRGPEIAVLVTMLVCRNINESLERTRELLVLRYPVEPAGVGLPITWPVPGTAVNALHLNVPGTPEDGGHHGRQEPDACAGLEDDSEEIKRYTWEEYSRCPTALPMELTIHVWQHRCDDWAKKKYSWDNSAARYIRDPV